MQATQTVQELTKVHGLLQSLAKGIEIPIKLAAGAVGKIKDEIGTMFNGLWQSLPGPLQQILSFGFSPAGLVTGAAVATGMAVRTAATFQTQQNFVQNNTTMTSSDVASLGSMATDYAKRYGGDRNAILLGAMHAMNLTGSMDATRAILDAATKSAISTGGDPTATAQILAQVMHEYGYDKGDPASVQAAATRVMGMLHQTAAMSDMTLEQISSNSGRALSIGANLNVSPEEILAYIGTLTKHGMDPAVAQTQALGALTHMINPSKQQQEFIKALSARSGVDLTSDFSAQGLASKGIDQIVDDMKQAFANTGMSGPAATEATMKMLNAMRGGLGFSAIAGVGNADYKDMLGQLQNNGLLNSVTDDALNRTLGTLDNQLSRLSNTVQDLATKLGNQLLPQLTPFVRDMSDNLPKAVDYLLGKLAVFGPFMAAFGGAMGAAGKIIATQFAPQVDLAADAIGKYLMPATYALGLATRALNGDVTGAVDQLKNDTQIMLSNLADMLGQAKDWVVNTGLPQLITSLGYWTAAFIGWTQDVIKQIPGALQSLVDTIKSWISEDGRTKITDAAKSFGQAFVDDLKDFFTKAAPTVWNNFTTALGNAKDNAAKFFGSGVSAEQAGLPNTPGAAALVQAAAAAGWNVDQVKALYTGILSKENGPLDPMAKNPNSSAFGLFQKLDETSTDPLVQAKNGLAYVMDRYGDHGKLSIDQAIAAATKHEQDFGWYAMGGWINEPVIGVGLRTGRGYGIGENGPEYVSPRGARNAGGSTYTFHIDARGAVEGTAEQIQREFGRFVAGLERHLDAIPAAHGA